MKRYLLSTALFLACTGVAQGHGLLIPTEPDLPPLAMLNHHVEVKLEDQVSVTRVRQTFRNHTDQQLEATYVFPVPKGASVRQFAMWVNGKKCKGELIKAEKAKAMYTSIVRQTKNPALLDYIGSDLLRLKIFPIPAKGDQKIEVSFTAVAKKEHGLVEYVYPLKTDHTAASTLEEFRLTLSLSSQQPLGSIYSPTHEVVIERQGDHRAVVRFEQNGTALDRDFQLFYTTSGQDVGLTALAHRPISDEDGFVMLLVSPRAELSKQQRVPRDVVFVIDTSGSMMFEGKMKQAKGALRHCLGVLASDDRFALVSFASTVESYRGKLVPANEEHIKHAKGWVEGLYSGGGTAIDRALKAALALRGDDAERMFTVVFITDGQPTIGERDTEKILANITKQNTANTRIFSLGLGNDLNAVLLDQIAEKTHALCSYVRPQQDIETKVASFFKKIHHPVLANLKLSIEGDARLAEVYPPELPDLFHGDQLVILARYKGAGKASIRLDGKVGMHERKFVYQVDFKPQADDKPFVEELWARRKVGYLLDQIRINGEQKELVDEIVRLAKGYGITTPYTSYLIMPDTPLRVASAKTRDASGKQGGYYYAPAALVSGAAGASQQKLVDFARKVQKNDGDLARTRGRFQDRAFERLGRADGTKRPSADATPADKAAYAQLAKAKRLKGTLDLARGNLRQGQWRRNQYGKLGVELSLSTSHLKGQNQLQATALRRVASRNCLELGGVWIDEGFTDKTPTLTVKAQSPAYFRILERQPQMKEVFQLGNHVLWITPNGTGLVIDTTDGRDRVSDREIDALFASK
ncbi:MAG: VWA domain-containing protein [Planctomycetes bacterium]|nr:VWA domain-containing protein [Planctomycetota bacterium]